MIEVLAYVMGVIILQYTTCIKSIHLTLYIYTVFYVSYSFITVGKKEKGRKKRAVICNCVSFETELPGLGGEADPWRCREGQAAGWKWGRWVLVGAQGRGT